MQLTIDNRYLKLPITREMKSKRLLFQKNGQVIADLVSSVDPIAPQYWFYWDARELLGQTLEFSWEPKLDYMPEFVDEVPMDGIYQERYRPTTHFSPSRGWNNDPNGLVFYEGKYHMFFQHNPVAPVWGNMHWGHAISTDLVHWEETEITLFPDDFGTMFSGSAIVDHKNVTGLKENDHAPLLLYYTAAGNTGVTSQNKKFTQCLAYSVDGGVTFKKYEKNPVVPHIAGENRDPKVIYATEEKCYYMALYLEGNEFALLTSENLLDWTLSQKLILPEDAECPDFFPLTTASGKRYWIFIGASDKYLVGTLEYKRFNPVQGVRPLQIRGKYYAAQTFSNIPNGRILRIGWNQSEITDSIFNGSMSTPAELSLLESNNGLSLCINPVQEFNALISSKDTSLTGASQDISIEIKICKDTDMTLSLLGLEFRILSAKNILNVKGLNLPLFSKENTVRMRIITDVHATEIYIADGQIFTCVDHIADYNLNRLDIQINKGSPEIRKLQIYSLKNIWTK